MPYAQGNESCDGFQVYNMRSVLAHDENHGKHICHKVNFPSLPGSRALLELPRPIPSVSSHLGKRATNRNE